MEENPYKSPEADQFDEAEMRRLRFHLLRIIIACIVCPSIGMVTWIFLILWFFGDSTEYWPGWACAVPAVVVASILFRIIVAKRPAAKPGE